MKSYGLPYTGSKNRLAEKIIAHFPEADTLVDGFFGGGAITHCAMVHNKFKNYIANDLRTTPQFFKECMEGKHSNDLRWISAEDFKNSSRDDWFVRLLWSFSNNCNFYMYGREKELYGKAFHYAICFNDFSLLRNLCDVYAVDRIEESVKDIPITLWNERRLQMKKIITSLCNEASAKVDDLIQHYCITHLARLQRIVRMGNLEKSNQSPNITYHNLDYRLLADIIPDNSVVYLDPPYKGTFDYNEIDKCMWGVNLFNTEEFLDWAYEIGKKHPTFISEYCIEDNRFQLIDEWNRCHRATHSNRHTVTERLYTVK